MRLILALFIGFVQLSTAQSINKASVCELVDSPASFAGKQIEGTAIYVAGVHEAFLYDSCTTGKKTVGLTFGRDYDVNSRAHRKLIKKASKSGVRVRFAGTFRNERGLVLDRDMAIVVSTLQEVPEK
jgi:hypothetical protein